MGGEPLSSLLGQPKLGLFPTWARVPTWSGTYECFVDFSKAFDTVWRKGLLYKLMLNNLSYKFIKLIENMYQGIKCSVKLSTGTTLLFNSYVGLRQGCNLSPMLFYLFINDIFYIFYDNSSGCFPVTLGKHKLNCLMYAGDLLILSETEQVLISSLHKLKRYSDKWRLTISEKKTKIMIFNKVGKFEKLTLKMGNLTIKSCSEYNYLRTTFQPSNTFKKTRIELVKKARKSMFAFVKHVNIHNGAQPKTIMKLFNSLVTPILLYNSEIFTIQFYCTTLKSFPPQKEKSQNYGASINSNGLLTFSEFLSLKFLLQ